MRLFDKIFKIIDKSFDEVFDKTSSDFKKIEEEENFFKSYIMFFLLSIKANTILIIGLFKNLIKT